MATVAVQTPPSKALRFKGAFDVKDKRGMEWDEALTTFLRSRTIGNFGAKKPVRENTITWYQFGLGKLITFMRDVKGLHYYNQMTEADVLDYVQWVRQQGWKQNTASSYLRTLRAFFRWVKKDPECSRAGMHSWGDILPTIPKDTQRTWIPSPEVMSRYLNSFDQTVRWGLRDYVIASLILDCGPRIGEICAMRLSHLKIEGMTPQILIPEEGKTDFRIVPVDPDTTVPLLRRWLRERERFAKTDHVFLNKFGGRCTNDTIRQSWEEQRTSTGIGNSEHGNLTPHVVRHFFCTHYLVNGGALHNLKQITGHKSVETLMIYVHLANQMGSVAQEHRRVSPLKNLGTMNSTGQIKKKRKMF